MRIAVKRINQRSLSMVPRWLLLLAFLTCLLSFGLTYWIVFRPAHSFFAIKSIVIETEKPISKNRIEKTLSAFKGQSLLTLRSSELVSVLRSESWISEVSVRKLFPDELQVTVSTKKPLAIYIRNGMPTYIDNKMQEISKVTPEYHVAETLPVLTDSLKGDISAWKQFSLADVLAELKEKLPNNAKISEVSLSTYPTFRVFLNSPALEIVFHFETWRSQLSFLPSFLKALPQRFLGMRRINLTLPKKAVVSLPNPQ